MGASEFIGLDFSSYIAPRVVVSNIVKVRKMVKNIIDTLNIIRYILLSQNKCMKKNATNSAFKEAMPNAMDTLKGPKSIKEAITVMAVNKSSAAPTVK
jgi:hypothetical protein